jgi:hypothetical protein
MEKEKFMFTFFSLPGILTFYAIVIQNVSRMFNSIVYKLIGYRYFCFLKYLPTSNGLVQKCTEVSLDLPIC